MRPPLTVAVLASGEGTTLDGLATALSATPETVRIVLVVSDRPDAPALVRARAHGLATLLLPREGSDDETWAARLTTELASRQVELVVLAGFLSILPPSWVHRWEGRAVNLHPSLLPKYGGRGMHGRRIHEAVIAGGDAETGVTVHLVTTAVDAGPSIAQQRVSVLPNDTPKSLRERLRPLEVELLAATVRRFADGSLALPYPGGEGPARIGRLPLEPRV